MTGFSSSIYIKAQVLSLLPTEVVLCICVYHFILASAPIWLSSLICMHHANVFSCACHESIPWGPFDTYFAIEQLLFYASTHDLWRPTTTEHFLICKFVNILGLMRFSEIRSKLKVNVFHLQKKLPCFPILVCMLSLQFEVVKGGSL